MLTPKKLAKALEADFKYPLSSEELDFFFEDYIDLCDPEDEDELEEVIPDYRLENIHWTSLPVDTDMETDDTQQNAVLARQLMGLFTFKFGYDFGNTGKNAVWGNWLAFLAPDGTILNVAHQFEGSIPVWKVLEHPTDLEKLGNEFDDIQKWFDDDKEKHKELALNFLGKYPKVCYQFKNWFSKFGLNPQPFKETEEDKKLTVVYKAFELLANTIIERANGPKNTVLSEADYQTVLEAHQTVEALHLKELLLLLATYLSGDATKAKERADKIRAEKSELESLAYWVDKVIRQDFNFAVDSSSSIKKRNPDRAQVKEAEKTVKATMNPTPNTSETKLSTTIRDYFRTKGLWQEQINEAFKVILVSLGVKEDSAFYEFYTHVAEKPVFKVESKEIYRREELYHVPWQVAHNNFNALQEKLLLTYNIPKHLLPLSNFEELNGYFYNTRNGEVYELEMGEHTSNTFNEIYDLVWDDFNAFLKFYFEIESK